MNKNKGVTLLELLIAVAIIAVVATLAIPSYGKSQERYRLKQVAENFKHDMQRARVLAVNKMANVTVNHSPGSDGRWCYGFDTKICDCATPRKKCAVHQIKGEAGSGITLSSSHTANTHKFKSDRGTAEAGRTCFKSVHYAVNIIIAPVGRIRLCAVTNHPYTAMPGFADCTPTAMNRCPPLPEPDTT